MKETLNELTPGSFSKTAAKNSLSFSAPLETASSPDDGGKSCTAFKSNLAAFCSERVRMIFPLALHKK